MRVFPGTRVNNMSSPPAPKHGLYIASIAACTQHFPPLPVLLLSEELPALSPVLSHETQHYGTAREPDSHLSAAAQLPALGLEAHSAAHPAPCCDDF